MKRSAVQSDTDTKEYDSKTEKVSISEYDFEEGKWIPEDKKEKPKYPFLESSASIFAMIRINDLVKRSAKGIFPMRNNQMYQEEIPYPLNYALEECVLFDIKSENNMNENGGYPIIKELIFLENDTVEILEYYEEKTTNMNAHFSVKRDSQHEYYIAIVFPDNEGEEIIIRNGEISIERTF